MEIQELIYVQNAFNERYSLWKFFADEHSLYLTEGELDDILHEVEKYLKKLIL